jgi:protein gp37
MAATKTGIEWTDTTWNPVTGCTKVSSGCDHCYAATLANRLLRDHYLARDPINPSSQARMDPFAVRLWAERLEDPLKWSGSRRIFVNSMSDLFHTEIPDEFIRRIFSVMLRAQQHQFQILTKRPSRALRFWRRNSDLFRALPIPGHIWIGASIENQANCCRVDHLRQVPAEIRFLSCEPLLGPIDLNLHGIHWVIVGGESGPVHRKLDLTWARGVRDQCIRARVPFFFKQVGGRTPKAGGRRLDGRLWNEMPAPRTRSIGLAAQA